MDKLLWDSVISPAAEGRMTVDEGEKQVLGDSESVGPHEPLAWKEEENFPQCCKQEKALASQDGPERRQGTHLGEEGTESIPCGQGCNAFYETGTGVLMGKKQNTCNL